MTPIPRNDADGDAGINQHIHQGPEMTPLSMGTFSIPNHRARNEFSFDLIYQSKPLEEDLVSPMSNSKN